MSKTPAIELAPGVWRIPTAGKDLVNSFALVQEDGSVTLVDTGLKSAPPRIVAGLAAIGKHPRDVTRIVLTHVHPDHAGGAARMSRETGAPVLVHADDHGWATSGRVTGANDTSTTMGKVFARWATASSSPSSRVRHWPTATCCRGGVRVVHTPGHSPGHVSLLLEDSGVMVTGDAIFNFPSPAAHPLISRRSCARTSR